MLSTLVSPMVEASASSELRSGVGAGDEWVGSGVIRDRLDRLRSSLDNWPGSRGLLSLVLGEGLFGY